MCNRSVFTKRCYFCEIYIAAVFHDLKFAETKGTGIATMKRLMHEAGLSTPRLIETDQESNKFNLLLLPHHLLDELSPDLHAIMPWK
ncbi:MAG: hypothetical protein KGR16_05495 [Verrucomicrobia bacterium]|nr:hypothetical protein [Verrucomicrobiota bacterium]